MIGSLLPSEFYPNPFALTFCHKGEGSNSLQPLEEAASTESSDDTWDVWYYKLFSCHSHQDEKIRKSVHISVSQVVQQWCITVNCAYTACEQLESLISLCKVIPCLTHERERWSREPQWTRPYKYLIVTSLFAIAGVRTGQIFREKADCKQSWIRGESFA